MNKEALIKVVIGLFSAVVLVLGADAVCAFYAKNVADDIAADAAVAAAGALTGKPLTQTTAEQAYAEAVKVAGNKAVVIRDAEGTEQDFFISADGGVTLTVEREAFSLVLKHIPATKHYTAVRATRTKSPSKL